MQTMGLYSASSLFMDGYLNTRGTNHRQTLEMIQDAGFDIVSDQGLEELMKQLEAIESGNMNSNVAETTSKIVMKTLEDLRPVSQ